MHFRPTLLSTLLIVVFLSAHLSAATADDTSTIQFKWLPGISAEVSQHQTRATSQGDKEVSRMEVTGSFNLTTSPAKDGILVDIQDHNIEVNHEPEQENDWAHNMIQRLASIYPAYIVSNDGALLRVSELKQYQSVFREELDTLISNIQNDAQSADKPELKAMFEGMNNMFDGMLTEEALYASIQSTWQKTVGQWIGFELEAGTAYETEFITPVPMLNNAEIPTKAVTELLGSVSCEAEAGSGVTELNTAGIDTTLACVELKFTSFLDPEATKSIITSLFEEMGMDMEMLGNFTMSIDNEYYLVTETNSLLPHSSLEIKSVVASIPASTETTTQTERIQHKYIYKSQ